VIGCVRHAPPRTLLLYGALCVPGRTTSRLRRVTSSSFRNGSSSVRSMRIIGALSKLAFARLRCGRCHGSPVFGPTTRPERFAPTLRLVQNRARPRLRPTTRSSEKSASCVAATGGRRDDYRARSHGRSVAGECLAKEVLASVDRLLKDLAQPLGAKPLGPTRFENQVSDREWPDVPARDRLLTSTRWAVACARTSADVPAKNLPSP